MPYTPRLRPISVHVRLLITVEKIANIYSILTHCIMECLAGPYNGRTTLNRAYTYVLYTNYNYCYLHIIYGYLRGTSFLGIRWVDMLTRLAFYPSASQQEIKYKCRAWRWLAYNAARSLLRDVRGVEVAHQNSRNSHTLSNTIHFGNSNMRDTSRSMASN